MSSANIRIKVFLPGNKRSIRKVFYSPPGQFWTAEGIQAQLEHTAKQIEQRHPGEDYRLVPLGPAEFNFVWAGTSLAAVAS
jgi:hypothetical protein